MRGGNHALTTDDRNERALASHRFYAYITKMTKAFDRIAAGLLEAIEFANGRETGARVHRTVPDGKGGFRNTREPQSKP